MSNVRTAAAREAAARARRRGARPGGRERRGQTALSWVAEPRTVDPTVVDLRGVEAASASPEAAPHPLLEPAVVAPMVTVDDRGGPTLDDLIVGSWGELTAHRAVACLVCGEAMAPRYGSGAVPVGGRCGGCGSTLG